MNQLTKADELIKVSFIVSGPDPNAVIADVTHFSKDKFEFEKHYSTTAIPGQPVQSNIPGQMNVPVQFITSCLCIWKTTKEEYTTFQNKFALANGNLRAL